MNFTANRLFAVAFALASVATSLPASSASLGRLQSPLQPLAPAFDVPPVYTPIAIAANDSIQTDYISTFPTGAKQTLVQIVLTDTASSGGTALFGMTAASKP